ncbi:MAG TPA: hypothetical protein VGQ08_11755 [Nitrospiraceae bacterium]|nr:hypothetical protein [Nitrospiraceae bacterium]
MTIDDVRQFHPLQPVLVQLVEVDRQIQDPHEYAPLSAYGPGGGFRCKPSGDVGESVFCRERVESALAETG